LRRLRCQGRAVWGREDEVQGASQHLDGLAHHPVFEIVCQGNVSELGGDGWRVRGCMDKRHAGGIAGWGGDIIWDGEGVQRGQRIERGDRQVLALFETSGYHPAVDCAAFRAEAERVLACRNVEVTGDLAHPAGEQRAIHIGVQLWRVYGGVHEPHPRALGLA